MHSLAFPVRAAALLILASLVPAEATARLLPDPPPSDRLEQIRIGGTIWSGAANGDIFVCRFLKDGVLHYTSPTGTFPAGGTWKQKGNTVTIDMTNGYAIYVGTIRGNRIEGTASNVTGFKWTWSVKMQ